MDNGTLSAITGRDLTRPESLHVLPPMIKKYPSYGSDHGSFLNLFGQGQGAASADDLSSILIEDHIAVIPKTKVCCTVGSKSRTVDELVDLLNAGMSIARFDFSWGNQDYHSQTLANLEEAMRRTGKLCSTMLDTRGPELIIDRSLGNENVTYDEGAPEPIRLKEDDYITITTDLSRPLDENWLPVNSPSITSLVEEGDIIFVGQYLFTGSESTSVYMEVVEVNEMGILCKCNNSGDLCGKLLIVQIVGKEDLEEPTLTYEDMQNIIEWGIPNKITFISLSFTKHGRCVELLKKILADKGSDAQVVAKVERITALRNLSSILEAADAIILSRACLGLDVPVEKMALIQKMVLQQCNIIGKPCLVTRVMDSMCTNPRPTRAEATDVANIVLDGADGILLGAETLRGEHASIAVKTVLSICKEAEKVYPYDDHFRKMVTIAESNPEVPMTHAEAVASSAVRAAMKVNASMLVVFTESGTTSRLLSKYRPRMPILSVIIPRLTTNGLRWRLEGDYEARRGTAQCGVFPVLADESATANSNGMDKLAMGPILDMALSYGKRQNMCVRGNYVVVCQRIGNSATVKVVTVK